MIEKIRREIDGTLWWWKHCIGVWWRRRRRVRRHGAIGAIVELVEDDQEQLCRLEREVGACSSGTDIGMVQFGALMGREWCGEEGGEAAIGNRQPGTATAGDPRPLGGTGGDGYLTPRPPLPGGANDAPQAGEGEERHGYLTPRPPLPGTSQTARGGAGEGEDGGAQVVQEGRAQLLCS